MPSMTILIGPYAFALRAPYVAGHTLTADEASAFNEWRARGVISNMRVLVTDAAKCLHEGELLSDEAIGVLQEVISRFDAGYAHPMERGTRNKRNTCAPRRGLIEREAIRAAGRWLEESNRAECRKLHKHDFDAEVERLAATPRWRAKAREIIRMKAEAAA